MIKLYSVVLDGDKPYKDVFIVTKEDRLESKAYQILGKENTVILNRLGENHRVKWFFIHKASISLIIINDQMHRAANNNLSVEFENLVIGNSSFGPGYLICPQNFNDFSISQELLNEHIFQNPVVFITQHGVHMTDSSLIISIESSELAPKSEN